MRGPLLRLGLCRMYQLLSHHVRNEVHFVRVGASDVVQDQDVLSARLVVRFSAYSVCSLCIFVLIHKERGSEQNDLKQGLFGLLQYLLFMLA